MTKRLTESQIVGIPKEAEAGTPVLEVCRTHSVGQSTFYKWIWGKYNNCNLTMSPV